MLRFLKFLAMVSVLFSFGCDGKESEVKKEKWKYISEFGDHYQVSTLGRVKSLKRRKILSTSLDSGGYPTVLLSNPLLHSKRKRRLVHRLVAKAFILNPRNKREINHKNAVKTDNRATNLEWCTRKENVHHAKILGLIKGHGKGGRKKGILCVETGEIYESASDAARFTGIHRQNISSVAAGLRPVAGGYTWRFSNV